MSTPPTPPNTPAKDFATLIMFIVGIGYLLVSMVSCAL